MSSNLDVKMSKMHYIALYIMSVNWKLTKGSVKNNGGGGGGSDICLQGKPKKFDPPQTLRKKIVTPPP